MTNDKFDRYFKRGIGATVAALLLALAYTAGETAELNRQRQALIMRPKVEIVTSDPNPTLLVTSDPNPALIDVPRPTLAFVGDDVTNSGWFRTNEKGQKTWAASKTWMYAVNGVTRFTCVDLEPAAKGGK